MGQQLTIGERQMKMFEIHLGGEHDEDREDQFVAMLARFETELHTAGYVTKRRNVNWNIVLESPLGEDDAVEEALEGVEAVEEIEKLPTQPQDMPVRKHDRPTTPRRGKRK